MSREKMKLRFIVSPFPFLSNVAAFECLCDLICFSFFPLGFVQLYTTCSSSYCILCTWWREKSNCCCRRPSQKKKQTHQPLLPGLTHHGSPAGGLVYRRQQFDRSLSQVLDLVGSGSNKRVGARVHLLFCLELPFRLLERKTHFFVLFAPPTRKTE